MNDNATREAGVAQKIVIDGMDQTKFVPGHGKGAEDISHALSEPTETPTSSPLGTCVFLNVITNNV